MKIVCVGRNYAAHARELGHAVPEQPILFLKPATAVVPFSPGFSVPTGLGTCHHEAELCLRLGQRLSGAVTPEQAFAAVDAVTLGLDLTLRDLQQTLKTQGHPWERAKAFDGAAPLAPWLSVAECPDWMQATFFFSVNGAVRQRGRVADMLHDPLALLQDIARVFTLLPGDVVMTGTPEGVAALAPHDALVLGFDNGPRWASTVRVA